jgi:hypothetical protein
MAIDFYTSRIENISRIPQQLYLLHELNNVFILQHVSNAYLLWMMLDRRAPHQGVLELLHYAFVDTIAKM